MNPSSIKKDNAIKLNEKLVIDNFRNIRLKGILVIYINNAQNRNYNKLVTVPNLKSKKTNNINTIYMTFKNSKSFDCVNHDKISKYYSK